MSGFSKNISSISNSLDKFNDQLPDLVKNMRGQLQELHRRKVIVHRRNVIDDVPYAKTVDGEILDAKYMPRRSISYEDFVRRRNEVFASASEALASASSILNKARASAEAGASAGAMPLYKNQLVRWGGAALGSQVLRGAG